MDRSLFGGPIAYKERNEQNKKIREYLTFNLFYNFPIFFLQVELFRLQKFGY